MLEPSKVLMPSYVAVNKNATEDGEVCSYSFVFTYLFLVTTLIIIIIINEFV